VQETSTPGLRERKKQQTRHRLEAAAVAIVSEDGIEHLTIDAVSERAEVSPRTFFNYFDSKEDAILGLRTEDDTRQFVDAVVAELPAAPLIDNVLEMLVRVSDSAMLDHELRERRRAVLHRYPELLGRHFGHMGRMLNPLTEGVQALMARDGEGQDAAGRDAATAPHARAQTASACGPHGATGDPHAQVVLMMCGAALRASMNTVAESYGDLSTDQSLALLHTRAAALVRETIERLS
jgi:AcrR family transcriptional regulator